MNDDLLEMFLDTLLAFLRQSGEFLSARTPIFGDNQVLHQAARASFFEVH
jgi:hypothetical protein